LTDAIPSTVKNSFVKDITDLDLPEPEGAESDDIELRLRAVTDGPETAVKLAEIFDNENVFDDGVVADPYDRLVLRLRREKTPPLIIPFDYPLLLWYKNFSDTEFVNLIRLPQITMPPPPSDELRTDCNIVEASEIFEPENPHAADVDQYVHIKYNDVPTWGEIGHRTCETGWAYGYLFPFTPCQAIKIRFHNTGVNVYNSPDNWLTHFIWRLTGEPVVEPTIAFPAFALQPDEELSFYVALDNSLYYDLALTQLAKHNGSKIVNHISTAPAVVSVRRS
ncbi:unnamed protein product, partial [marine sediment metagenome]